MSLPARGARIEITSEARMMVMIKSLPARGARIEIIGVQLTTHTMGVAPRKGSAD